MGIQTVIEDLHGGAHPTAALAALHGALRGMARHRVSLTTVKLNTGSWSEASQRVAAIATGPSTPRENATCRDRSLRIFAGHHSDVDTIPWPRSRPGNPHRRDWGLGPPRRSRRLALSRGRTAVRNPASSASNRRWDARQSGQDERVARRHRGQQDQAQRVGGWASDSTESTWRFGDQGARGQALCGGDTGGAGEGAGGLSAGADDDCGRQARAGDL
jgi:hypothetical protein